MNKDTDSLVNEIRKSASINEFIAENTMEFDPKMFVITLNSFLNAKKVNKQTLIRESYLNPSYVYEILSGKKKPSRDTVIKLSLALSLTLMETGRLLKLSGFGDLYPRIERDAIFIFCIENQKDLHGTNELLNSMGEVVL